MDEMHDAFFNIHYNIISNLFENHRGHPKRPPSETKGKTPGPTLYEAWPQMGSTWRTPKNTNHILKSNMPVLSVTDKKYLDKLFLTVSAPIDIFTLVCLHTQSDSHLYIPIRWGPMAQPPYYRGKRIIFSEKRPLGPYQNRCVPPYNPPSTYGGLH